MPCFHPCIIAFIMTTQSKCSNVNLPGNYEHTGWVIQWLTLNKGFDYCTFVYHIKARTKNCQRVDLYTLFPDINIAVSRSFVYKLYYKNLQYATLVFGKGVRFDTRGKVIPLCTLFVQYYHI